MLEKNCTHYIPADCFTNPKQEAEEKFGLGLELQKMD
jgi:hypothetical protein